jgi:hypothetical protein
VTHRNSYQYPSECIVKVQLLKRVFNFINYWSMTFIKVNLFKYKEIQLNWTTKQSAYFPLIKYNQLSRNDTYFALLHHTLTSITYKICTCQQKCTITTFYSTFYIVVILNLYNFLILLFAFDLDRNKNSLQGT